MGLEFNSEEEACNFYCTRTRCHGFIMRKEDISKNLNGNIVMRQLVCNRKGMHNKKYLMRLDRLREHKPIT